MNHTSLPSISEGEQNENQSTIPSASPDQQPEPERPAFSVERLASATLNSATIENTPPAENAGNQLAPPPLQKPRRKRTPAPRPPPPAPPPEPDISCSRHIRKCQICMHPKRLQIEDHFVHWRSVGFIADLFGVSAESIYRHGRATGLYPVRQSRLRWVLDYILQQASNVKPTTPDHIIRAVRAYTCITDDGQWIEPPSRVIYSVEPRIGIPVAPEQRALPDPAASAAPDGNAPNASAGDADGPSAPRDSHKKPARPRNSRKKSHANSRSLRRKGRSG